MISGGTTTAKLSPVGEQRTSTVARRCSVVIVGYQGERWLPDCLTSLAVASSERLHLLLVDNGGNGNLNRLPLADFETDIVQTPHAMGFADANNYGLVRGGLDAETVCFLNQDTLGEPGWIDACLRCFDQQPRLGAVSPMLKTWDAGDWDEGFRQCSRLSSEFLRDEERGEFGEYYATPQVSAAAMLVRTRVLQRVGPFDPIFGSYYEDYDLCRRFREVGYSIGICGHATVRHYGGSSTTTIAAENRRTRQVLRNRAIHRIRESGAQRRRAFVRCLSSLPRNLLRGIARTPSSQPVRVQLAAYYDLLQLAPRMTSAERDHSRWQAYLREIGWPAGSDREGHAADCGQV